jgi:peptidoglycan/xylan/chitin deacetylase (PgdA/CDA1 family)
MVSRIIRKLNRIANDAIFNSGLLASYNLRNTQNTIIMYHGVDLIGNTAYNSRHTSQDHFRRQIQFLKKYCHIISLEDFFKKEFRKGKPNIALTFDDGYRNNFLYVKPILEQEKIPSTFYITGLNTGKNNILWADFLNIACTLTQQDIKIDGEDFLHENGSYFSRDTGKNLYTIIKEEKADFEYKMMMQEAFIDLYDFKNDQAYDDYWKLMTDTEIMLCSDCDYIDIGSHGFLHNNLGKLTLEMATNELKDSKKYLENIIQKKVTSIGYPDGSYTRDTIDAAESVGFKYQTAVGYHFEADKTDNRIQDRKGIYTSDSCANQLMLNL